MFTNYFVYFISISFLSCSTCARHGGSNFQDHIAKRLDVFIFDTRPMVSAKNLTYPVHQAHYCTSEIVWSITGCLSVSEKVKSLRLRFFGHLACFAPEEDLHRVIAAALRPLTNWRRLAGRPITTWLRNILMRMSSSRISGSARHEEGKKQGYLATSRQYGNVLLGVCHQEEECMEVHCHFQKQTVSCTVSRISLECSQHTFLLRAQHVQLSHFPIWFGHCLNHCFLPEADALVCSLTVMYLTAVNAFFARFCTAVGSCISLKRI